MFQLLETDDNHKLKHIKTLTNFVIITKKKQLNTKACQTKLQIPRTSKPRADKRRQHRRRRLVKQ